MSDIDPCALVSQTAVQALFKDPLGTYSAYPGGECNWPVADQAKNAGIDIDVNTGSDVVTRLQDVMGSFSTNKPLTGVGDQAMYEVNGVVPSVGAVKGQVSCQIRGGDDNTSFAVTVDGNPPFDEINAGALPGFMAKFGTLCNEIFASLGSLSGLPAATESLLPPPQALARERAATSALCCPRRWPRSPGSRSTAARRARAP